MNEQTRGPSVLVVALRRLNDGSIIQVPPDEMAQRGDLALTLHTGSGEVRYGVVTMDLCARSRLAEFATTR